MTLLTRLTYVSELTAPMSTPELERLSLLSQRNNYRRDVTGALGCTGHFFVQFIEGRDEEIQALMKRIARDPRHCAVLALDAHQDPRRRFGSWSMRYFDSHALEEEVRAAHRAGISDRARADWLIQRMVATLPPGESLDAL